MKTRSIAVAAGMALAFHVSIAGVARAQFVPGHVFVAEAAGKICMDQAVYGGDRIWEIDPATGETTLFVAIPEELCGFLTGLAFTPDGTRLRASSFMRDEILEFDSEGNMTVALDSTDGIACPWGLNNLAYDEAGNFYVVNQCTRNILRFPVDGGAPTVFIDGVGSPGSIGFAADGDLYLTTGLNGINLLRRITPEGNAFPFDSFGSIITAEAVTADASGNVYVGLETAEVFRYDAGDPASKELLTVLPSGGRYSMTMSPDQTKIYLHRLGGLLTIDVLDGAVTWLGGYNDGLWGAVGGVAVVPILPPPIPTISHWGMVVLMLLLLAAGTIAIPRNRGIRIQTSVRPARQYPR